MTYLPYPRHRLGTELALRVPCRGCGVELNPQYRNGDPAVPTAGWCRACSSDPEVEGAEFAVSHYPNELPQVLGVLVPTVCG